MSVGELDEDRMLLHDTLDVLAADTNDAFVVLVRHVERDRSRHLLFHQTEALLHRVIGRSVDVDVEIVLAEVFEHYLDVAYRVCQRHPHRSNDS